MGGLVEGGGPKAIVVAGPRDVATVRLATLVALHNHLSCADGCSATLQSSLVLFGAKPGFRTDCTVWARVGLHLAAATPLSPQFAAARRVCPGSPKCSAHSTHGRYVRYGDTELLPRGRHNAEDIDSLLPSARVVSNRTFIDTSTTSAFALTRCSGCSGGIRSSIET